MTFIDSIRRQLQAMSATERQRAISSLRDLIYEDAYTHALHPATDDGVACPRCGSLDVVRKGHDHDGTQRWLSFSGVRTPAFRPVVKRLYLCHAGRFWFSMYRLNVSSGAPPAVPA